MSDFWHLCCRADSDGRATKRQNLTLPEMPMWFVAGSNATLAGPVMERIHEACPLAATRIIWRVIIVTLLRDAAKGAEGPRAKAAYRPICLMRIFAHAWRQMPRARTSFAASDEQSIVSRLLSRAIELANQTSIAWMSTIQTINFTNVIHCYNPSAVSVYRSRSGFHPETELH